jgi:predicted RNase H-like HicB family nuclease
MRYVIMIRRTSTAYNVDVPDIPGCVATGTTVEHARLQIAEAIEMHLELLEHSCQRLPVPSTVFEFSVNEQSAEELCTWVEVEERQTSAP